jgi:hypothetical protein
MANKIILQGFAKIRYYKYIECLAPHLEYNYYSIIDDIIIMVSMLWNRVVISNKSINLSGSQFIQQMRGLNYIPYDSF